MKNGKTAIVIGLSQEPTSLWELVDSSSVTHEIAQLGIGIGNTQYNYDYQAVLQDGLSTIESGKATNEMVEVKPGDLVYSTTGMHVKLDKGVKIVVDGKQVEYDGSGPLKLPQLVVRYKLVPYTWSDGTAGSEDDIRLAYKVNCDTESGATTYLPCDEIQKVDFGENLEWTVTYYPGAQDPTYMTMPWSVSPSNPVYPSHQVLKDGRKLADVPAKEWGSLPEITETPLSHGPYTVTEWVRGKSIKLAANPHYEPAPAIKNITVVILEDSNQAVTQFLSGKVDYLERATLVGGADVQTVFDAAEAGKVNLEIIPSPTWEHIDFNLFTK